MDIYKQSPILAVAAAVLCYLFFFYGPSDLYHAITQAHAHIGYQVSQHNDVWMQEDLARYERERYSGTALVEYTDFYAADRGQAPRQRRPFPVNDTIGYGVVLGLLWKITGSLSVRDAQIVQMLLYIISIFFVYNSASIVFGSAAFAWWATCAHLAYFPLIALVVQPVRDVWAYYATVVLLWGLLHFLRRGRSWFFIVCIGIVYALFQWIRPTVFLTLCAMCVVLAMFALLGWYPWRRILCALAVLCITNAVCFWVPFCAYNVESYGRCMVGPVGQDLLEGLGEFSNPWGYQLSDEFVASYVGTKYHVTYGTPEFDDAALVEFKQAYAQYPSIYWLNMLKRMPQCIVPALPWLFPKTSAYEHIGGWYQKIMHLFSSVETLWDAFLRHVLIRIFLLLCCGGMIIAWRCGYKEAVMLAFAIALGGLGKLPSHIEYRYLVPFYWVFSLFLACYGMCYVRRVKR